MGGFSLFGSGHVMPSDAPISLTVADGDVLTVTADAGSYGTVFGPNGQWNVGAKSPLRVGPGHYRIETVIGTVRHSLDSQAVAALKATLPRATEIVGAAANIAGAIMLQDKFKRLAERAKAVPAKLGERADAALARLDAVEARSVVFDKLDAIATDAEQSVAVAEDALNQLTNGNGG
jgi:hypothetical protein